MGLLGFCGAGTEVLLLATQMKIVNAVVTIYGDVTVDEGVLPKGTIEKIGVPVQSHFGLLDTVFPLESTKIYEKIIKQNNKKAQVFFYKNCGHSYCNFSIAEGTSEGFDYNFQAAMKTYERLITFFKTNY